MPSPTRHAGRTYVPLVLFIFAFLVLILYVIADFLLPAMHTATTATTQERAGLSAYSRLLLSIILILLISGLLLTFRIGRRWNEPPQRTKTEYPDAWEEAGRRMKTPP